MRLVCYLAHCLLNANAKVDEGARCAGVSTPVLSLLREHGAVIRQMPCPELAFGGTRRFWAVREQYDTIAHRRHCRRIVEPLAAAITAHVQRGDEVVLIGVEGSPSLGVALTSSDPARGGKPEWPDGAPELAPGQGIFLEELHAALARAGVQPPRSLGLTEALPDHEPDAERAALGEFLEN